MSVQAKPIKSKTFQFPEVRVVEASAGTGKTYALAKRYVQLLLNPTLTFEQIPIRNILAITFTNKASFEMKARILEFLKKVALQQLNESEVQEILAPLDVDPKSASDKAFAIMKDLIHNYNFFQVQTIDSFINALLSGCAFKIGLSANFKIKRNAEDYLEHSLDQLIDLARSNKAVLKTFHSFLHQYLFIENRSGWFPKKDMLSLMMSLYRHNNTYGLEFGQHRLSVDGLFDQKMKAMKNIKELGQQIPEGTDRRFVNSLESFLQKYDKSFDVDGLSDYFAREEFPARKGTDVPRSVDRLWRKIRKDLEKICEGEALSIFNCYIEVFNKVTDEFYELAAKDDILFLEELNKRARRLFDEGELTVPELYYRLATRFRHYLIDEFQDTSLLQWQNLSLMAEEALSTGGSLFYVGDKKQAIYGFRGGEARLFDEIKKQFSIFNVQSERLEKNYRSQKAIIEFNNKVFAMENLERFVREIERKKKDVVFSVEDFEEVKNVFGHAHQEYLPQKDAGYVKVEYIDRPKKEERDEIVREKLIQLIGNLRQRFSYRDITVLTRSNLEVEQVTSWLMEEGIFVEAERTTNIKENFLIQELAAFLQFLDSPIDNRAFAHFLLGDMFTKISGIDSQELHDFVFGLRKKMDQEKDVYIYKEFRQAYLQTWGEYLNEFFKNVGLYPLYELVVSIVKRFDILKHFPEYQGFIMRFLELIKSQEEEHNDITSFLEYFENVEGEDIYVNVSDSDSIKILTIHKSKGLEFPVVVIPFLEMDVQVGSGGKDNQQSYMLDIVDEDIHLLRLKKKYRNFSPLLAKLWSREYKKSFLSELNNTYVALTRAGRELYVFIPQKAGNSFNLVNLLIPEEVAQVGKPVAYERKGVEEKMPRLKLPPAEYRDWIEFLKDEFLDFERVRHRNVIFQGEVLHFILSRLGNLYGKDKERELAAALEESRLRYPSIEDFTDYEKKVYQLIHKKELKKFFEIKEGEVFQEMDTVNALGHTKIPDRLIVLKDEAWIVDYKSSPDDQGRYHQQVKEYKEIVGQLYPDKTIRGFLIYFNSLTVEKV